MRKRTVGEYLKRKRLDKGFTLNHACLLSDVSYSTLVHWEENALNEIRFDSLNKIMKLYDISASDFVRDTKCFVDVNKIIMEN